MTERILITGGAGFIGSNFVHQTVREHSEFQITVVDAMTYAANKDNLKGVEDQIDFVEGDICNPGLMDDLVSKNDVVVNFAGESHVDNSLRDPDPFVHTNLLGVYSLLKAIRKYDRRLHHVSTDEVFGDLPLESDERFTESTPYKPSSPYAATKASADMLIAAWVRSFGLRATVSMCANNYGPRQHVEKFIPRQITNILLGERPKLYGAGANIREWTHVDDHNAAVHAILSKGKEGETYIIGAGEDAEAPNKQVMGLILELMGQPEDAFDSVADRAGHDMRYATDTTKIRTELGWRPRYTSLRDGLVETIKWYRDNVDYWRPQKQQTEERYGQ
ncbi:MAG TPA: dTDP-glucose 4,6-dehydratase [Candidatus Saccharimonadales bacterium]